jgi:hypothetical protein
MLRCPFCLSSDLEFVDDYYEVTVNCLECMTFSATFLFEGRNFKDAALELVFSAYADLL